MRNNFGFYYVCILLLIFTSCMNPYEKGIDFVRKYSSERESFFKENDCIYFSSLDPSSITFIDRNEGLLSYDNPNHQEILKDFLSEFDIDTSKFYSPNQFFAEEFNKYFKKGLSTGSYKSKYDDYSVSKIVAAPKLGNLPNKNLIVESIDLRELKTNDFEYQKVTSKKNGKTINVLMPKKLQEFCSNISKLFPKCEYFILMHDFFISNAPLTYSIQYQSANRAGQVFLIPKTIIDIKNAKIVGYDLNQTFIEIPKKRGIKINDFLFDRYMLEGLRINQFL